MQYLIIQVKFTVNKMKTSNISDTFGACHPPLPLGRYVFGSWSCLIKTKELSTFYFGCAAVVAVFPHSTIECARVSHLPIFSFDSSLFVLSLGQGQPWTYWLGDFIYFHLKTAIAY